MMNAEKQSVDGGRFVAPGTSCQNCEHYESCGIWRGVRSMFEQQYPFMDPDDLAVICEQYDPKEP